MRIDTLGNVNIPGLTASRAVFTDASDNLVSKAVNGTGDVVLASSPTITGLNIAAGTSDVAPIKLASGTNLSTVTAGAIEYDGTSIFVTPNASIGRAVIPFIIYTSGQGTNLSLGSESVNQPIFPTANDIITLSSGTYFIQLNVTLSRGAGGSTVAQPRINLGGGGTAVGTFSGTSTSRSSVGTGAGMSAYSNVALTVDNLIDGPSGSAATHFLYITGILRITSSGTIQPKYSMSINLVSGGAVIPGAGNFMTIQSLATSSTAASSGGWQ
jgi:hypothetical protein